MRIALIKLDTLPDLWIGNDNSSIEDLILSSQMRIGPIGLFERFDCEYYIIKSNNNLDLMGYQSTQITLSTEEIHKISLSRGTKNTPSRLDVKQCYSFTHKQFSLNQEDLDLSQYKVVVTVNLCFTPDYMQKFKNTIFILLPSEGKLPLFLPKHYSYILNHKPTFYLDILPTPVFSFPFSY